ncbi:MAG: translocation/assembly module TamB domain-containing protein [Myxococcales bacterium]
MKRVGIILEWLGSGAVGLAALVLLLALAAAAWLQTESGNRRVREEVLSRVGRVIAGELRAGRVEVNPGGFVLVRDAELLDPEGRRVAFIGELRARVVVGELLRRRVRVVSLGIKDAELLLAGGPDGINIARAFAPRQKGPEDSGESGGRFGWDIQLERGLISGLRFAYRTVPEAEPVNEVREVSLAVSGRYRDGELRGEVGARGRLLAPVAAPFALVGEVKGGSDAAPYDPLRFERVALEVGGSRLQLGGSLDGGALRVAIREAFVRKDDLLSFAPQAPVAGDLTASGTASLDGNRAQARLLVPLGEGSLSVDASADLSPLSAQASVELSELDLSLAISGAPPTRLNGSLGAHYRLDPGEPGRGDLELSLRGSRVRGARLESARARVELEGVSAKVRSLALSLPGGRVEAAGTLDAKRLDAQASVRLTDLDALSNALAKAFGTQASGVAGRGRLEASASGPWSGLQVGIRGELDRLTIGSLSFDGLAVKGRLPDASRPYLLAADVQARGGKAGELPFSDLRAKVEANRRDFSADLTTKGLAGLTAHIGGALDPGVRGGRIARLVVEAGDAKWVLDRPARLDLRDGFRVDRLELSSGRQWLELRGGLSGARLDASARSKALDLAALPAIAVPRAWKLAGLVDLEAKVTGTTSRPKVEASVDSRGLGFQAIRGVDVTAKVELSERQRLSGEATIRKAGARAQARFDLPTELFAAKAGTPLSATLELSALALADLREVLGIEQLEGALSGTVSLGGTADKPDSSVALRGSGLRYGAFPEAGLALEAQSASRSSAKLELALPRGKVSVDLRSGVPLATLVRGPKAEELAAAALDLAVTADKVALEDLPESVLGARLLGEASLSAHLLGSLEAPRGEAKLKVTGGGIAEWRELGVEALLSLGGDSVGLDASVHSGKERLVHLLGKMDAAPEKLQTIEGLEKAPVHLALKASSEQIARQLANRIPGLAGKLQAEAKLTGSLGNPRLELKGGLAALTYDGKLLGDLKAKADHGGGRTQVAGTLGSAKGGAANLEATVDAPLSLSALQKGFDPAAARLEGSVRTSGLQVGLVEELVDDLRRVEGRLGADLKLRGTLASPRPEGTVTLRDGRFTLLGYGSYEQVTLDAKVGEKLIQIVGLSARSEKGSIGLSAKAERDSPDAPYRLGAALELRDFPLRINDRKVATISGKTAQWTGQIQGSKMALDVRLERLVAELPPLVGGKELQELEAHPGIVIVTGEEKLVEAKKGGAGLDLRLHIQAPRNLWVQSSDARIEAGADLTLIVHQGKTEMSGAVTTRQGSADVIGRKFELARGHVSWAGDPPGNPKLEVIATHENTREQVKVKVTVTGDAAKPRIELSSEPPLDEQQIAILLATGRRELKRGSGNVASGSGAASVIGSFAADRLRKTLASKLPIDVLQVDIDDTGLQSAGATFRAGLEAGTYVTDDIYIGYLRNFGADTKKENTNEVRVEYQLTPRVNIESKYGDEQKGGVDVIFSKDY